MFTAAGRGRRPGSRTHLRARLLRAGHLDASPDVPDTPDASEDTCTRPATRQHPSWLLDLPSEVTVVSVRCGDHAGRPAARRTSSSRTTSTTTTGPPRSAPPPSAGNVTMTGQATSYSGTHGGLHDRVHGHLRRVRAGHRAKTPTDRRRLRRTTTAYTPGDRRRADVGDGYRPSGPGHHHHLRPGPRPAADRHQPGRLHDRGDLRRARPADCGLEAGPPQATGPADETYSYEVGNSASVRGDHQHHQRHRELPASETLYDSLGREVETQTETPDGKAGTSPTAITTPTAGSSWHPTRTTPLACRTAPWSPPPRHQVPSQTGYVYDGDGRVIQQITYKFAAEQWETDTSYGGDYTTVAPPSGGTTTDHLHQRRGQQSRPSTSTTPANADHDRDRRLRHEQQATSGWDQTAYIYTSARQLKTVTDAAGKQWTYGYDLAGDQTSADDPDTGTTNSTYDPTGSYSRAPTPAARRSATPTTPTGARRSSTTRPAARPRLVPTSSPPGPTIPSRRGS